MSVYNQFSGRRLHFPRKSVESLPVKTHRVYTVNRRYYCHFTRSQPFFVHTYKIKSYFASAFSPKILSPPFVSPNFTVLGLKTFSLWLDFYSIALWFLHHYGYCRFLMLLVDWPMSDYTLNSSSGSGSGFGFGPGMAGVQWGIGLSNTIHSEVAPCLPLPSLPVFCGASEPEIRLFDEARVGNYGSSRSLDRTEILAQSSRIADLLRETDISYL